MNINGNSRDSWGHASTLPWIPRHSAVGCSRKRWWSMKLWTACLKAGRCRNLKWKLVENLNWPSCTLLLNAIDSAWFSPNLLCLYILFCRGNSLSWTVEILPPNHKMSKNVEDHSVLHHWTLVFHLKVARFLWDEWIMCHGSIMISAGKAVYTLSCRICVISCSGMLYNWTQITMLCSTTISKVIPSP